MKNKRKSVYEGRVELLWSEKWKHEEPGGFLLPVSVSMSPGGPHFLPWVAV